jgi:pimeloyl-ACP methyl ester carboxylesterase/DNA-binding CsgD family transcriptional regulator
VPAKPPLIKYCSTPAGRVAYSRLGSGPALLCDPGWITHLTGQLELFDFGPFMTRLAERYTVIRYDKPGCGLSDRDDVDLSFEAQVAAAIAVTEAAGADRFTVFGASQGGQIAAAIAARLTDRVEAAVLYGTCGNGADLAPAELRESLVALVRAHWGFGSKVLTGIFVPEPSPAEVEQFTRLQQASASAKVAAKLLASYYLTDVRPLLPAIKAPTVVLHRQGDPATRFRLGREVASLVPGSTLIPLSGSSHLFYHGDWTEVLDAMLGFLGGLATHPEGSSCGPGDSVAERQRLTARELEVAALVADGLTNLAIASRLSIAPRTAETHVENIRRKLEVRSRAQIAAWVTEHRVRPPAS